MLHDLPHGHRLSGQGMLTLRCIKHGQMDSQQPQNRADYTATTDIVTIHKSKQREH